MRIYCLFVVSVITCVASEANRFSFRVTVRVMRVRNALPAHLPCATAKADTTWTLCRIKNAKQCVAEIVSIASFVPRGGDGREVCDPGMACVTHLPLVVEVKETGHGMDVRREQVESERMRTGAAVHGSGAGKDVGGRHEQAPVVWPVVPIRMRDEVGPELLAQAGSHDLCNPGGRRAHK